MTEKNESIDIMSLVAEVVAAYVSNHEMASETLPSFIHQVYQSLCSLSTRQSFVLATRSEPAVPIDESVQPDYIICLEDGRCMKMLKRHLKTAYNMTPEQYRERWNLPVNYPMVAPSYAKRRQSIAKDIGLGTHRKRAAA